MVRLERQLALRLSCLAAFVVALVAAPGALAQGTPATTFSAAGSAADIYSGDGPCAVAVAGVSSGAGVAGSGTFTAAEGADGSGNGTVCGGSPASLHFAVTGVTTVGPGHLTLAVKVTSSDDTATPSGTTGTIDVDATAQSVNVAIGSHTGGFTNGPCCGFLDLRSDVHVDANPSIVSADYYAGTGTAHPLYNNLGACVAAVAGTQAVPASGPAVSRGGGGFQATTPNNDPNGGSACNGGQGYFTYEVAPPVATDGQTTASAALTVTNGTDPGATNGNITLDEPTQQLNVAIGAHNGGFGPGHSGFGGFLDLRGDVEIGSSTLVGTTDLQLTKSAPSTVPAGSHITYTLTAKNVSLTPSTNTELVDTLPVGVTYVSSTPGGACTATGGTVTCELGTVAPGDTATVTIEVATTATTPSPVANTALVHSTELDATPGNNMATATTTLTQPTVDLSVTKTASPSPALVGSDLDYHLVVANSASATATATGTTLTDTLPAGVTFTSASAGCSQAAGVVTCHLGSLAPGASAAADVHVTPTAAGTLTNTATVTSNETDSNPVNNSATIQTQANAASADVSVTKTAPATVAAGGNIAYHLVVSNAGPQAATGTTLTDALPAGVGFVSVTPGGPTCTQSAGTVTCSLGTLAPGASSTVDIVVSTSAATPATVTNTATVSAAEDTTPGNDTATATTTVTPAASADVSIQKTAMPSTVNAGSGVVYHVKVSNAGPQAATHVTSSDPLPATIVFYSAHASQGSCSASGNVVTCDFGTLAAGASATADIVVQATQPGSYTNTATVHADQPDPNPGNNACSATVQVNPAPTAPSVDVQTAMAAVGHVQGSQPFSYSIAVRNLSTSHTADGVTLTATLPGDVVYDWARSTKGSCSASGPTVTCNIGTIAPGAWVSIALVVKPTDGAASYAVTATATASEPDPVRANNTATAIARR